MKKYGRLNDEVWKNVEDLRECFDSRDTLKTQGFSCLGLVICVCYLKQSNQYVKSQKCKTQAVEHQENIIYLQNLLE